MALADSQSWSEHVHGVLARAGLRRGGARERIIELLASEATLQIRADRVAIAPYGLSGGHSGKPARNTLLRDRESTVLPGKVTTVMRAGDVARIETAGGGGWGDPADRSPERRVRDEQSGLASAPGATRLSPAPLAAQAP